MVIIGGASGVVGHQRTTAYENDGQWMMEGEAGDVTGLIVGQESLCKIWKVPQ